MIRPTSSQAALRGLAFSLLLVLSVGVADGRAGSFSVNPVRVDLSSDQRVASLRVHNSGSEPASIQLTLMNWSQEDGESVLEPLESRTLLVTPPIFSVAPGESQVVRVGMLTPPDPEREQTYRLILQEIPPPTPEGFQGLQVALRLSVPVFVAPAAATAEHRLAWRLTGSESEGFALAVDNQGNGHARITRLQLGENDPLWQNTGNDYVLPGNSRHWQLGNLRSSLPTSATGESITLTATVNGEEASYSLPAP